jgi:hypothetical protein
MQANYTESMTSTNPGSLLLIVVGCALAYWGLRLLLPRMPSRRWRGIGFALLVVLSSTVIQFIDLELPLDDCHWQPDGEPVPGWLALLAWVARWLPLLSIAAAMSLRPPQRPNPTPWRHPG